MRELSLIHNRKTGRASSWDKTGRNSDYWIIPPGESRVLADISGPSVITHIWMTQKNHYRDCLIKITYDNSPYPSVLVPLGDFFCLGHGIVNSFQSLLFSVSTRWNYQFNKGAALNCYAALPFAERAVVELINESKEPHMAFFYIDYESLDSMSPDTGYFHAEFRRTNPFSGWGPQYAGTDVVNKGEMAWDNNYVILDTKGRGHYVGCNLSVTNFTGKWWGEGDDMIWVDGYKWPPDLHGTGSEDYLNQAWGMQDNSFLRNGSSIFSGRTVAESTDINLSEHGKGYQTSYVFHIENPVRFSQEIKVTIEHGHGNHLANEMSSVAYWYTDTPTKVVDPPPVAQRMPVLRDNQDNWLYDKDNQCPSKSLQISEEMRKMKNQ